MQNLENFQNKQPTRFLNGRLPPAGVFIAKMKGLLKFDKQILGVDLGAGRDVDRFDLGVTFGVKARFHFHRFYGQ
jgi:hypothetical protein